MNNDIPRDMNSFIKVPKNTSISTGINSDVQDEDEKILQNSMPHDVDMEKSMNYMLGKFQVDSKKPADKKEASVQEALEKFLNNPEFAQSHVELCDELVKKGYSLEDAIEKADMFFDALQSADTYH